MATVEEKVLEALRRVKADTDSIRVLIAGDEDGNTSLLDTGSTNLVDAINEVRSQVTSNGFDIGALPPAP